MIQLILIIMILYTVIIINTDLYQSLIVEAGINFKTIDNLSKIGRNK